MSTSSSCVSMKRGPFESLVCGQETASIEGAPPWMREPRRWGFSVSRSEYFQVSAINCAHEGPGELAVAGIGLGDRRQYCHGAIPAAWPGGPAKGAEQRVERLVRIDLLPTEHRDVRHDGGNAFW